MVRQAGVDGAGAVERFQQYDHSGVRRQREAAEAPLKIRGIPDFLRQTFRSADNEYVLSLSSLYSANYWKLIPVGNIARAAELLFGLPALA